MEKEEIKELFKRLTAYFPPDVVEWRIINSFTYNNQLRARVSPYVDARAIMDRLDDVLGPENWQNHFSNLPAGHLVCAIGIRVGDDWIWKEDGGGSIGLEDDSKEEEGDDKSDKKSSGRSTSDSAKGDLTNAFKRCAQGEWGIGRYLYSIKEIYTDAEKKGKSTVISKIPIMPKEFLPEGYTPKPPQQQTGKTEPPKEEKKPAEKKQEAKPINGNNHPKETPPPEPKKKEVADKNLQRALSYKIPKNMGLPFEDQTLEKVRKDVWIGKGVIGFLAGKLPHPQKGDMYAPLSDDEVKLSKAAEYVWDHTFAENQPANGEKK